MNYYMSVIYGVTYDSLSYLENIQFKYSTGSLSMEVTLY